MTKHVSALILSAVAFTGCAQSPKSIAVATGDLREIRTNEVTAELKLDRLDPAGPLTSMHRDAVAVFGSAFEEEGHGPIIISAPKRGGESSLRAVTEARAVLLSAGVKDDMVVQSNYDASGVADAPIVLTYRTYDAGVSPNCPTLASVDFSNTHSNGPLASFGCAVNANLAAQIARPGDLVEMAKADPADAGRRMVVFSKYREGTKTGAERDPNGSATISQAVSK